MAHSAYLRHPFHSKHTRGIRPTHVLQIPPHACGPRYAARPQCLAGSIERAGVRTAADRLRDTNCDSPQSERSETWSGRAARSRASSNPGSQNSARVDSGPIGFGSNRAFDAPRRPRATVTLRPLATVSPVWRGSDMIASQLFSISTSSCSINSPMSSPRSTRNCSLEFRNENVLRRSDTVGEGKIHGTTRRTTLAPPAIDEPNEQAYCLDSYGVCPARNKSRAHLFRIQPIHPYGLRGGQRVIRSNEFSGKSAPGRSENHEWKCYSLRVDTPEKAGPWRERVECAGISLCA
jgi:hypothetical protein